MVAQSNVWQSFWSSPAFNAALLEQWNQMSTSPNSRHRNVFSIEFFRCLPIGRTIHPWIWIEKQDIRTVPESWNNETPEDRFFKGIFRYYCLCVPLSFQSGSALHCCPTRGRVLIRRILIHNKWEIHWTGLVLTQSVKIHSSPDMGKIRPVGQIKPFGFSNTARPMLVQGLVKTAV